jgi:hypothetical protein
LASAEIKGRTSYSLSTRKRRISSHALSKTHFSSFK